MAPRRSLSVVKPGEAPPSTPQRLTIRKASETSYLDLLITLREKISTALDVGVPAHALPALSRRLLEIAVEIETISLRDPADGDEISDAAATPDEPFDIGQI